MGSGCLSLFLSSSLDACISAASTPCSIVSAPLLCREWLGARSCESGKRHLER